MDNINAQPVITTYVTSTAENMGSLWQSIHQFRITHSQCTHKVAYDNLSTICMLVEQITETIFHFVIQAPYLARIYLRQQ